jgi:hypothetical protein
MRLITYYQKMNTRTMWSEFLSHIFTRAIWNLLCGFIHVCKCIFKVKFWGMLATFEFMIFCLSIAYQEYKDYNIQNFTFICCFIWVCETFSTWGKNWIGVFENRRLRRIFVRRRQGMKGNWRKLCNEVKGKAVPQHTMEAQGERRYSFYSFMTSALNGGEWLVSCPSRTLPLGNGPSVPTGQEAGWTPDGI